MLRELFLKTDKMLFFSVLVKKSFFFSQNGCPASDRCSPDNPNWEKKEKERKKCNKKIFEIYKKIYDHQSTIAEAPEAVV